jgi:hypothetical protein
MKLRVIQIFFSSIIVVVAAYIVLKEPRTAVGCDPCYFENTILPTMDLFYPIFLGFLFLVISRKIYNKYNKIQYVCILFFVFLIISYFFSDVLLQIPQLLLYFFMLPISIFYYLFIGA